MVEESARGGTCHGWIRNGRKRERKKGQIKYGTMRSNNRTFCNISLLIVKI